MKLYLRLTAIVFLLLASAWGIPKLISGSDEQVFLGMGLMAILPVLIYAIFKEKKNAKSTRRRANRA